MAEETLKLSNFIANLKYEDIPAQVLHEAKRRIADTVACGIYAASKEAGKKINSYVKGIAPKGAATIWKSDAKTTPAYAVLANCSTIFHVELDDVHRFSHAHCGLSVVPPALAVGEAENASGRKILESVAAGYEVVNRVGRCISPSIFLDRRCMPCAVMGGMGGAAAAGKIYGFDGATLAETLGNAGFTAPLCPVGPQRHGAGIKEFSMGWSAFSGIMSAEFARNGFYGSNDILESDFGFCTNACDHYNLEKITDGLGEAYELMYTGLKPYSHCRQAHSAIDCVLDMRKKYGLDQRANEIRHINVRTFSVATRGASKVFHSLSQATYSIPFAVAVCILFGNAWIDQYVVENLTDSRIVELAQKVDTCMDPELEALYDEKWPAIVEIEMNDGTVYSARHDIMKGEPENPMTDEELKVKFLSLMGTVFSVQEAQEIWELIFGIENLENIGALTEKLR